MISFKKYIIEKENLFWNEYQKIKEKYKYVAANVEDWEYNGNYSGLEMARFVNSEYSDYKKEIQKLLRKFFKDNITVYRTPGKFGSGKNKQMVSVSLNKNYGNEYKIPTKNVVFIGGESEEELIVDSKFLKGV